MAAAVLPVLITGGLLFTFRPKGPKWWDYLDQIWRAYETAEGLEVSVLPALQVWARMLKEVAGREGKRSERHAAQYQRSAMLFPVDSFDLSCAVVRRELPLWCMFWSFLRSPGGTLWREDDNGITAIFRLCMNRPHHRQCGVRHSVNDRA